jgi:hypothetical protein
MVQTTNNIPTLTGGGSARPTTVSPATLLEQQKTMQHMINTIQSQQVSVANLPVDGTLFKIDYEPVGSKSRQKRNVCKLRTF